MKDFKLGLQLYSIRDDMDVDMDAALGRVAEIGYKYVEFAGGYREKSAEEIKALLDKHGLVISVTLSLLSHHSLINMVLSVIWYTRLLRSLLMKDRLPLISLKPST